MGPLDLTSPRRLGEAQTRAIAEEDSSLATAAQQARPGSIAIRIFQKRLQAWADLARQAIGAWFDDRAPTMGAAIAFYTMFSLAPILVIVIAIAGFAFGPQAAEGALFGELADLVGPESAGAVQVMLRSASRTQSGIIATAVGIGTLIVAATGVFGELQSALNVIWKASPAGSFSAWHVLKSRILSLSVILVIGFLLLVSLVISAALTAFSDYLDRTLPSLSSILYLIHLALSFGFTTVLFGVMFKILPDKRVEWQDVWLGAVVTALLFSLGKHLISLYVGSSQMASTYGAAGALIIVFVWIYYSAQIFLLGAEFAKAYGDQSRRE
jgi:membrane protein